MALNLKEEIPASEKYLDKARKIMEDYTKMLAEQDRAMKEAYNQLSVDRIVAWLTDVRDVIEADKQEAFYICEDTPGAEALLCYLREQIGQVLNKAVEELYPRDFMADDEFLGSEGMFVTGLSAFAYDGRNYVIEEIYGQGESATRIICPNLRTDRYDDDDTNYKAICRYPKISIVHPTRLDKEELKEEEEKMDEDKSKNKPDLSIEGILSRNDGTSLTLDDFIAIVEANGLSFGGFSKQIDANEE